MPASTYAGYNARAYNVRAIIASTTPPTPPASPGYMGFAYYLLSLVTTSTTAVVFRRSFFGPRTGSRQPE